MNWITSNFENIEKYGIQPQEFEAIINRRIANEKMSKEPETIRMTGKELLEAVIQKGRLVSEREKWDNPFSEKINTRILKLLCMYFTNDPKMGDFGLSPNKGIWLEGPRGCGKTVPLRLLSCNPMALLDEQVLNPVANFRYVHAQHIQTMLDQGTPANFYAMPSENNHTFYQKTSQKFCGWLIDDVGAERMGNFNKNHVAEVLSIIERTQRGNYNMFHVTTNLGDDEFGEYYGGRLVSRKYEMFNVLKFEDNAPDLRIRKVDTGKEIEL